MPPSSIDRDLQRLEAELKQLEAEYNMFFAGRLPKPPWETRARVEALGQAVRPRAHPEHRRPLPLHDAAVALRDVHRSVGSRPARARGRTARPVRAEARKPIEPAERAPEDRILHVSSFRDPVREIDKLHRSLRIAGRSAARGRRGRAAVPQVRRAGEDPGEEAARQRVARSGVPRGGEGREGELYGAGSEGRDGLSEVTKGLKSRGSKASACPEPSALSPDKWSRSW